MYAWGSNDRGQLGNFSTTNSAVPVLIDDTNDWVEVAAGEKFSMARNSLGQVYVWGDNTYGQLNRPIQDTDSAGIESDWFAIESGVVLGSAGPSKHLHLDRSWCKERTRGSFGWNAPHLGLLDHKAARVDEIHWCKCRRTDHSDAPHWIKRVLDRGLLGL